jgi:hypothetical protein
MDLCKCGVWSSVNSASVSLLARQLNHNLRRYRKKGFPSSFIETERRERERERERERQTEMVVVVGKRPAVLRAEL